MSETDATAEPQTLYTRHIVAHHRPLRPVIAGYEFAHAEVDPARRMLLFEDALALAFDETRRTAEFRGSAGSTARISSSP